MKRFLPALALIMAAHTATQAKVTLPSIFTSNMVLQQQRTLKIKGKATPNSEVSLQTDWSRAPFSTKADADGMWTMQVQTPKAGGPYTLSFSDGEETTLENVLVGEVWLGSGQSNMEMPLAGWGKVLNYEEEIKNANFPKIRLFQAIHVADLREHDAFHLACSMDGWQECNPEHVHNFSALCYFFALRLWEELKVPIGVIDDDWGGTPVESWTRKEILEGVYGMEEKIKPYKEKNYEYDTMKKIFEQKSELAKLGGGNQPWRGESPDDPYCPSALWNAMMNPLKDFPLKGFIWYQGCANVGNAPMYEACFQAMIEDWREQFQDPDMPFYFVQLANFLAPSDLQPESEWAKLREAQAKALCLKNTGMAVNIDLGDTKDIHPKTKRELGRRLAAIALNQTYGMKKIAYTAPIYKGYSIKGDKIHIQFELPEGSEALVQEENLPGFIVAGYNRRWHVAKACTKGNEVIVTCPEVKNPLAVRYGWADNPTCTLKTQSNLHVAPFRTDGW